MESMDKNGDGIITWDEFVAAAIDKIALLNKQNIRAAFDVLDENGDGRITKEELRKRFEGSNNVGPNEKMRDGNDADPKEKNMEVKNIDPEEKMWDDIMKQVDEDGCGSITWNEFKNCMNKVLKVKLGKLHDKEEPKRWFFSRKPN